MQRFRSVLWLALVLATVPAAGAPSEELAEEVRAAEIAFARTMATRDLDAFLTHVAEEAIFMDGAHALRGVDAIKQTWGRFFEGPSAPFSWAPDQVEVLDSGGLAHSSGPVLNGAGERIGTFNSVWRRDADGRWQVVFDKGCPPCSDGGD